MSYTTIQVKRTSDNKTLDAVKTEKPAYGEIVFSHTNNKDEFVIGDGIHDIEHLPRLNMQRYANTNSITLGDATHQGSITLYDGTGNTITIRPSEININKTLTLPNITGVVAVSKSYEDTDANHFRSIHTESLQDGYVAGVRTYKSGSLSYPLFNTMVTDPNTTTYAAGTASLYIGTNNYDSSRHIGKIVLGNSKSSDYRDVGFEANCTITAPGDGLKRQYTLPSGTGTLALVGGNIGAATASTPTAGDSSTKVATTEFVTNAVSGSSTDEKLAINLNTSGTSYYPIIGTGTTASIRQYDTNFTYTGTKGTTTNVGTSVLTLGNNIGSGTADNERGQLVLYGNNTHKVTIQSNNPTSDIEVTLPNSAGTLATTDDIANNRKVVLPISEPASPVTGQIYVDLTDANAPILKVWNGSAWKPIVGVWG